jgi:alpha-glucosidase (family GH31 glycosyl hydrolase)
MAAALERTDGNGAADIILNQKTGKQHRTCPQGAIVGKGPVFVKDGSLVPLLAVNRQWALAASETIALEVRHYGDAPGKLAHCDDSGETFDCKQGEFSWTRLAAAKNTGGAWTGALTPDAMATSGLYADVKWRSMGAR